ncbi:AAA family ATPase [Pediococcus pentosaceus]|uniref:ATP-binding protein n=1 Tax=Pediococcus pentosaceus TaxID=1255 RepID=UPI00132B42B7|nr:ATP-binding protein [Pediococcus pentosaceus]KAF0444175.1 AAA family ATPase [Pediococcus pentosaceus]
MDNYYLKSMEVKRFRNLIDMKEMFFARRINVISGHNGVGKSTILSLICSATGSKELHNPKGENFNPDFKKYFKVYPEETVEKGGDDSKRYYVYSKYERESDSLSVTKRIRLKNNQKSSDTRIQIIPELSISDVDYKKNKADFDVSNKTEFEKAFARQNNISVSGRLNVPTRYVSVSRVYPLGELNDVKNPTNAVEINGVDKKRNEMYALRLNDFYRDTYNSVLPDSISPDASLYYYSKDNIISNQLSMDVVNTKPESKSVGQNALGTIVGTIADFEYLRLTDENYSGGILCIDEVDTSLHPAAQKKLMDMLASKAEDLNLQIFLTSHSITILEEISRKSDKDPKNYAINYITDRYNPRIMSFPTIANIKADLQLSGMAIRPIVRVYFEDEISQKIHFMLLAAAKELKIPFNPTNVNVDYISAKGGKDFLRTIAKKDPYFKTPLIILDADSRFSSHEEEKNPIIISDYLLTDYNPFIANHNDTKDPINFMRLPNYFAPESYLYRIIHLYSQISPEGTLRKESRNYWEFVEEKSGYTGVNGQYVHQKWSIKKNTFNNTDLKKFGSMDQITEFIEQTNSLAFYYKNEDRKKELEKYIQTFNAKISRQEKIVASSRF